ncbi:hypothetical protein BJN34_22075 [Cupriavidus necator]|uniref:Uncharacterized protein n=1 Tax=Cupriavidus necator TaxID=106590 RepID=A0A1U9UVV7_CUPNE|nr:hypothetical protein [Cupriavidus necator]AQV96557.1 hypothetical protein BJN34_22075 [Cupriavidus necator]
MQSSFLVALTDVKMREVPRHPKQFDLCAVTNEPLENVVLAVAPRSYPELAEGLEIGAVYEHEEKKELTCRVEGKYHNLIFLDWCRILTIIVARNAKFIKECSLDEWVAQVAGALEDKEKYPETGGRGPFWELVRYGLRGATFGPAVCAKLVRDFDEYEQVAKAHGHEEFYWLYCRLRECFAYPNGRGLVYCYKPHWFQDSKSHDQPLLGIDPA